MGVDSTLGPILIGCAFSWALLGTLTLQTYLYFQWYRTDPLYLKVFVLSLILLEYAETAVSTHATWYFTIAGWGNPEVLIMSPKTYSAAVILTGFITSLVQFFFARRLKLLSMDSKLCSIIVCISLGQFVAAVVGVEQIFHPKSTQNKSTTLAFQSFTVWLSMSAGCNILIAIGMVYYLAKTRAKILIKSKQDLMARLIGHSIQTGAFMALCAILNLVLFIVFKDDAVQDIPFFILGKTYSITVLADLNSRQALVNAGLYVSGTATSGPFLTDPVDISWRLYSQGQQQFEMATVLPTSLDADTGLVPGAVRASQAIQ